MTGPRIHSDAVVSLTSLQPGLCISGSKDKVWIYSSCNFKLYSTDISCFEKHFWNICSSETPFSYVKKVFSTSKAWKYKKNCHSLEYWKNKYVCTTEKAVDLVVINTHAKKQF